MSRITLSTIGSRYGSIDALNANFEAIELALDNVLFLDNTAPNALQGNIDMDSNRILNLPIPTTAGEPINLAFATANYSDFQAVGLLSPQITLLADNISGIEFVANNLDTLELLGQTTYRQNINLVGQNIEAVSGVYLELPTLTSISHQLDDVQDLMVLENSFGSITELSAIRNQISYLAGQIPILNNIWSIRSDINTLDYYITELTWNYDNRGLLLALNSYKNVFARVDTNQAEVDIVSANIDEVVAVGGNIDDVLTVASFASEITDVIANEVNINKVGAIDTDVTAVANIDAAVTAVANNNTDISALVPIITDIQTLADIEDGTNATDAIQTVAIISTAVSNVSGALPAIGITNSNLTNINKVAAIDTNVTIVATNDANITKVANIDANVTKVANIDTNVTTVADNDANVTIVANVSPKVTTVADNVVNVVAVADNASNINAVFTNASNINAVVANETNINLVAAVDGNITTVANNLTDITNFADVYIGPSATTPITRNDGSALVNGDFYFNTSNTSLFVWTGSVWEPSIANTTITTVLPYYAYTSTGTLTNNAGALVDTSGGSYTLNLPASPSIGDKVFVADVGDTFGANNLTIGQNGSTIDGVAEDFIIDISGVSVQFIYTGTTWAAYAVVGGTSGEFAVDTTSTQTLTNKTLTSPTITSPAISGTVTGTISLTSPTITDAQLNNPTIDNYTEGYVNNGTVSTSRTFSLTNGTLQNATLTASTTCTFTMPTPTAGKSFVCLLKQAPTTGNGNATFTGVKWNGAAPTITAAAGAMDIISFVADGTNWYGSITKGYTT